MKKLFKVITTNGNHLHIKANSRKEVRQMVGVENIKSMRRIDSYDRTSLLHESS